MSQHPSLLGGQKGKQHRSVLKRYERLKHLVEKDKWDEKKDSIYRLPKIKSIKFKVKKEKAAAPEAEAQTVQPVGTTGVQPQTGQPQAPATKPVSEKAVPQKEKK